MTASGKDGGPRRGPGGLRRAGGERPQAPRGTYDVLPEQAVVRASLEAAARAILEPAGYGRIETPAFEATELFARRSDLAHDPARRRPPFGVYLRLGWVCGNDVEAAVGGYGEVFGHAGSR